MKRKYIAAILTVFAMTTVCSTAFGATEHYTDSSVVGAESGWDEWVANPCSKMDSKGKSENSYCRV